MKRLSFWLLAFSIVGLGGCSTQYVKQTDSSMSPGVVFNQDVTSKLNLGNWGSGPECIALAPVLAHSLRDREYLAYARESASGRLGAKGYVLVRSEKVDAWFAANGNSQSVDLKGLSGSVGCDHVMSFEISSLEKNFYGFFSEVRAGGQMRLVHSPSGEVSWSANHVVSMKDGGLPTTVINAATSVLAAGSNTTDDQLQRAVEELVRKMLRTLPDATSSTEPVNLTKRGPLTSSYKGDLDEWLQAMPIQDQEIALRQIAADRRMDYEGKERIYARLLRISDKSIYRRQLVRERLAHGKTELAREEAKLLTAREPDEALNWMGLANCDISDQSWAEAERALIKALAIRPADVALMEKLGYVAIRAGKPDRARASFQRALALDPGSAYSNYNLAFADMESGDFDGAAQKLAAAGLRYANNNDASKAEQAVSDLAVLTPHLGEDAVREYSRQILELLKENKPRPGFVAQTGSGN